MDVLLIGSGYSDTCLIYCHGLGSNKLEILPVIDGIGQSGFHFCAFDFAGSGRSEGKYTTFGVREQYDVHSIINWLDGQRVYNRYILWGRSMGAAAIILSQAQKLHHKVQCIVLDSPFCSFQKAVVQIASKNTFFPEMMLNIAIEPLKEEMKRSHPEINPFEMNICKAVSLLETKIMLIYSKKDTLVSWNHSK